MVNVQDYASFGAPLALAGSLAVAAAWLLMRKSSRRQGQAGQHLATGAALAGGAALASLGGVEQANALEFVHQPTSGEGTARFDDLKTSLKLSVSNPEAIDLAIAGEEAVVFDLPVVRNHFHGDKAKRLEAFVVPQPVALIGRAALGDERAPELARAPVRQSSRRLRALLNAPYTHRPESERVYAFVASGQEALTWQPRHANGPLNLTPNLAYESDRVGIGDRQAGLTYERHGVQASVAYVEREIRDHVGRTFASRQESFVGFTLTMHS